MSTGFVVTHARDAHFERGLRSFFEYRDLGIQRATAGRVNAHVIRAAAGQAFSGQPHLHRQIGRCRAAEQLAGGEVDLIAVAAIQPE